jgi:hypothetical protein
LSIKHYCPNCKHKVILELIPDYSESSLWCTNPKCGVPVWYEELPKLSEETISLIQIWNQFWVGQSEKHDMAESVFQRIFNNVGSHLAQEINKKYECKFDVSKAIPLGDE